MSAVSESVLPQVTAAVVAWLRTDPGVVAAVSTRVYTLVPETIATPFLAIMGGQEAPQNTLKHAGRLAEVLVTAVSAYRGTTEIDAVISAVITALDGQRLPLNAPWEGARMEWVRSTRPVIVDGADVYWERTAEFLARCA